jgi:hypothetical protein
VLRHGPLVKVLVSRKKKLYFTKQSHALLNLAGTAHGGQPISI